MHWESWNPRAGVPKGGGERRLPTGEGLSSVENEHEPGEDV